MDKRNTTIDLIVSQGMLPLFYHEDAEVSLEIVRTLYSNGVRVLEYTNRGDAALANFKLIKAAARKEMPGLQLGIGTIKDAASAQLFINAGADFIVCPVIDEAVGKLVCQHRLLWIPGCMTPTEINLAQRLDAEVIKLFPANILGPGYVSAVREIFQEQLFIPTGGVEINADNLQAWFKAGVCAVGMGSRLISKEILADKDYDKLAEDTRKALELIVSVR